MNIYNSLNYDCSVQLRSPTKDFLVAVNSTKRPQKAVCTNSLPASQSESACRWIFSFIDDQLNLKS